MIVERVSGCKVEVLRDIRKWYLDAVCGKEMVHTGTKVGIDTFFCHIYEPTCWGAMIIGGGVLETSGKFLAICNGEA